MRGVRGIGLRAILTLFIVLMSAGVAPLYAQDTGEGTPVSEVPAPTEEVPVDPAPEPPVEAPAPTDPPAEGEEPPVDGEEPPASEPGEGELPPEEGDGPVAPEEGDGPVAPEEGDAPSGDDPVEGAVIDEGTPENEEITGAPEMAPANIVADGEPDVGLMSTQEIGLDSTTPLRCEPGYWLFTILPDPGPDVQSATVTFTNGNVVELDRGIGNNRANFRTSTNLDSTVQSVTATVPADFTPSAFQVTAGPCNDEPVPGEYAVTINAVTSDGESAEDAGVVVTDGEGVEVASGTIGADNTYSAGELSDGAYTVSIDGWPADYNRVSRDFTVSNADVSVNVSLTRLKDGHIEVQAGESNNAGGARIEGATVTIVDGNGDIVASGLTGEQGRFRSQVLPPSIYTVTVDGGEVGFSTWTGDVSNERGSLVQGVVLERLTEGLVTITVDSANPDIASVMPAGSTWTVTSVENPALTMTGEFAEEHLQLPATITVDNPVPFGEHTVEVNAGPVFQAYGPALVTVDSAVETVGIELQPVTEASVTINISSVAPDVANVMPEGSSWSVSVGGTVVDGDTFLPDHLTLPAEIEVTNAVAFGTYDIMVDAGPDFDLYTASITVDSIETSVNIALVPAAAETFPVTITGATSDGGSAEGASVTIDDGMDQILPPLSVAPMAIVADGTLGADNTYTTELVAGEYTVIIDATEQGYGVVEATFTVPREGDVVVELTAEAPATGTVAVQKVYCEDLDEVVFNPGEDVIGDDCATGAATFTFYLVGDDSGEPNGQLEVFESGAGTIDLAVGTYELVEEGTQASATIEVVADEVTSVTVANPGAAPAPRDGTVNASVFTCSNIDEVIFSSDSFMTTFATLPTFEPACEPGAATLTFYLVGDGSGEPNGQITVDGTGAIQLAPGNYEVVEEGTLASTLITVYAGDFINLDVQIPAGGEVVPGSSVNIVKFYCDTATEVEFLAYDMAEYSDRDELPGAPDCVSGTATFTFYLVGDGTDDYAQIVVHGSGSIGLAPGIYTVVEEETQAMFDLEVLEGENTLLVVNNPMPEDGVPGPVDPGEDDVDDAPGKKDGVVVTELPSTGQGTAASGGMLMLASAFAAIVAGAGALVVRSKRI